MEKGDNLFIFVLFFSSPFPILAKRSLLSCVMWTTKQYLFFPGSSRRFELQLACLLNRIQLLSHSKRVERLHFILPTGHLPTSFHSTNINSYTVSSGLCYTYASYTHLILPLTVMFWSGQSCCDIPLRCGKSEIAGQRIPCRWWNDHDVTKAMMFLDGWMWQGHWIWKL